MNIVIIGGTSGIGRCLSANLINNHNVFIGARTESDIDAVVKEISAKNHGNLLYGNHVDASDFISVSNFLDSASKKLESIDAIINCAGSLLLKPPHMITQNEVENVFKTNAFSCLALLKFGFPYMKNSGGSFIFFSSAASKVGLKNHEVISGAKGAVSSIALSAASTYAHYNIRVNVVAPGLVETPLSEKITNNKMSLDYSKKMHGLNRIGKPENFIPIIDSLLDRRSDWITGQTIFVDGGLSNVK